MSFLFTRKILIEHPEISINQSKIFKISKILSRIWDLFWKQPFVWINTASVSIRPNYCNCVISFLLDLRWINLGINLLFFDEISSWELIDASCAFAKFSQLQWSDLFLYTFSLDDYFFLPCIEICVNLLWGFLNLLNHIIAHLVVKLSYVMLFRENKS